MAKATKKKATQKPNKYDITIKANVTADELFKMAINTPIRKQAKKK